MKKSLPVLVLVLSLLLSACSGTAVPNGNTRSESASVASPDVDEAPLSSDDIEMEDVLYSQELYVFPGGYRVKSVVRLGDALYFHGTGTKDGAQLLGYAPYIVDAGGEVTLGDTTMIDLPSPESVYSERIYGICAGADSFLYVLAGELPAEYMLGGQYYTNPDYQGRYSIIKYTASGEPAGETQITLPAFSYISGIFVNSNGRAVLYGGNTIQCVDGDGTVLDAQTLDPGFIQGVSVGADSVMFIFYCENGLVKTLSYDSSARTVSEIDLYSEDGSPFTVEIDSTSITQGLDTEYVIARESCLYACSPDDYVCRELFRWHYGVSIANCPYVCRLSENCFISAVSGEEYLLVTALSRQEKTERRDVKVALCGDFGMESALSMLNNSGGKYIYTVVRYDTDELDRLLADIVSDSPLDLVLFGNGLNTASAAFEDLYPYIDGDEELSRESFLPNLLEGLSVNGELHELWMDVGITTLAARVSDVGDGTGLTVDDYDRIVRESGKYEAVFQSFMSKDNLLKWLSVVGASVYVDKGSATCDFDGGDFGRMIEWCAEMGDEIPEGSDYPTLDISEVLLSFETITIPERLNVIRSNFGEPYVFVGFPVGQGSGSYYSAGNYGRMAIPATSRNKDGAWAFIRSQLVERAQSSLPYTLPVNRNVLMRKAEACLAEDELALFEKLLNDTKYTENYTDSAIRDIILECGRAYLAGDKTVDETVSIIQSKASIYLSEQYG